MRGWGRSLPYLAAALGLMPVMAAAGLVDKPPLCREAIMVCARAMQPSDVAVGGSFTVTIEDHFSATYECTMMDGAPRWAPVTQRGSCAPQPVILLPSKYDPDDAWNIG